MFIKKLWLFTLLFSPCAGVPPKKIYLVAEWWGEVFEETVMFIDGVRMSTNRDNCKKHMIMLKTALNKLKVPLKQISLKQLLSLNLSPEEMVLFFDLPMAFEGSLLKFLKKCNPEQLALMIWEPPTMIPSSHNVSYHRYFSRIFTVIDDFIDRDHGKYCKIYYPQPSLSMTENALQFKDKNLCVMIFANKHWLAPGNFVNLYQKRKEVSDFFEKTAPDEFALYGPGWSKSSHCYRGMTSSKASVLKNYKFCIAYENTAGIPGYVTEKIFDSMAAGCVPVYWGANNITKYIPANCFIDGSLFSSPHKLYEHLKSITPERYSQYIADICSFLNSTQARLFSCEYFVHTVLNSFFGSYNKRLVFNEQEYAQIKPLIN